MSATLTRTLAAASLAAVAATMVVGITRSSRGESAELAIAAQVEPATPAASLAATPEPMSTPTPIPVLGAAPDLEDIQGWINTELSSLDEIRDLNTVTVVQFWTFGCFNCKNTIPHLKDLYAKYGESGLEIVGVHSPEFSYEADPDNVAAAVVDLGVTWPVALDPEKRNFRSWQTGGRRFWPRLFVLDAAGNIRFDHIGEGAYRELADTVAQLLADAT